MTYIIDQDSSAILRLSEIITDTSVTSFSCTINSNVVVTIIDDLRAHPDMHVILQAETDAKILYQLEPSLLDFRKIRVDMIMAGQRAEIIFRAIQQLQDDQRHEIMTRQLHQAPYTHSKSTIRIVHADRSRSTYQGIIIVEKEGMHSEAFQDHKALLISDEARAYARPTLEAKTHELQCGHGSAIGFLDPEQLWYLQSRGISYDKAQKLLVAGFLAH